MAGMSGRVRIENPLCHMSDEELRIDTTRFVNAHAPFLQNKIDEVQWAAHVAKHIRYYEQIAHGYNPNPDGQPPPVELRPDEMEALRREKDKIVSERGIWRIFVTVCLAAFLQGFVQSSFTGSNVYIGYWMSDPARNQHGIGISNGIPYLSAALIGCVIADPVNQIAGRRGGILIAAVLICITSIAASSLNFDESGEGKSHAWKSLVGIRIFNGVGMGIKAVSTPILASETAIGYWRGSAILQWQLWVAFGIFFSFSMNLIFFLAPNPVLSLRLTLASPLVPALMLIVALYFTPESPRYWLRPHRGRYDTEKAYNELRKLRNTEMQALRDLYLVHRTIDFSNAPDHDLTFLEAVKGYFKRSLELFTDPRLRNSTISACTVNLGQQLCGINVFAFYSSTLFLSVVGTVNYTGDVAANKPLWRTAMLYSFGFGLVNFLFGIPAFGTIDTFGRRKWLLITIPGMALALMSSALGFIPSQEETVKIVAAFMFIHTIFYSPAMGPVPFTLASESFPLSHRENGCSVAIFVNLLFAGLLAWFYPLIDKDLGGGAGSLGLFAGLNVVALVMVFLLVEETKQRDLEDLDQIYRISKRQFMRYQATVNLPWLLKWVFCLNTGEKPDFYEDATKDVTAPDERESQVSGDASGGSVPLQDVSMLQSPNGHGPPPIGPPGPLSPPGSPPPPASGPTSPTSVPEVMRPGPTSRYD